LVHDEVERLGVPVELPLERVEHPEQRGEEVRGVAGGVAEEVASCSGIPARRGNGYRASLALKL
jgi:hypothetical protein